MNFRVSLAGILEMVFTCTQDRKFLHGTIDTTVLVQNKHAELTHVNIIEYDLVGLQNI